MYNRLFTKILDSSIWLEPLATRVVWITFLAAMDQDGFCSFACPANVARRAGVTQEECDLALTCLLSPDSNSSDPDNNGKRLERVPGGYLVLNAVKYREMLNREIQREQTRIRVARHRKCNGEVTPCNATVTVSNEKVTPSEAEAFSESEAASEEESFKNVRKRTVTNRTFQKPSSVELELHASKIGLPKEEVSRFVNYYEANGWRVGRNPMKSWSHAMQNWKINFDANRGSAPTSRRSAMDIRTIMQAKEKLCSTIRFQYASETAMDTIWSDDDKRIEYFKLKKEIKALNTELSEMV